MEEASSRADERNERAADAFQQSLAKRKGSRGQRDDVRQSEDG